MCISTNNNFVTNIKTESLDRLPMEYVQVSDYFSNYIILITEVKFTSGSLLGKGGVGLRLAPLTCNKQSGFNDNC